MFPVQNVSSTLTGSKQTRKSLKLWHMSCFCQVCPSPLASFHSSSEQEFHFKRISCVRLDPWPLQAWPSLRWTCRHEFTATWLKHGDCDDETVLKLFWNTSLPHVSVVWFMWNMLTCVRSRVCCGVSWSDRLKSEASRHSVSVGS